MIEFCSTTQSKITQIWQKNAPQIPAFVTIKSTYIAIKYEPSIVSPNTNSVYFVQNIKALANRFMTILQVITHPNPNLRNKAKPVTEITAQIKQFVQNMLKTMYHDRGIGLAATQVDFHERIIVLDISDNGDEPVVLINPEVIKDTGTCSMNEGCLSLPGLYVDVVRPEKITIRAIDLENREIKIETEGLKARCILHEIDHLNGHLSIDHVSRLKRDRALKKYFQELKNKDK